MIDNYALVQAVSDSEFEKAVKQTRQKAKMLRTPDEDIVKIERILNLSEGLLKGTDFYFEENACVCGRRKTFYDFVFTAVTEQWHSPSFVAHTLLGNKKLLNVARKVKCSSCLSDEVASGRVMLTYETPYYGCSWAP